GAEYRRRARTGDPGRRPPFRADALRPPGARNPSLPRAVRYRPVGLPVHDGARLAGAVRSGQRRVPSHRPRRVLRPPGHRLCARPCVDLFHGTASFAGGTAAGSAADTTTDNAAAAEIEVTREDQEPLCLRATNVVIATGARPAHPDTFPVDQQFVLDATGMRA